MNIPLSLLSLFSLLPHYLCICLFPSVFLWQIFFLVLLFLLRLIIMPDFNMCNSAQERKIWWKIDEIEKLSGTTKFCSVSLTEKWKYDTLKFLIAVSHGKQFLISGKTFAYFFLHFRIQDFLFGFFGILCIFSDFVYSLFSVVLSHRLHKIFVLTPTPSSFLMRFLSCSTYSFVSAFQEFSGQCKAPQHFW